MKNQRRFLSLALALVLCLGLLPTAATAAGNDFIIQDGVLKGYRGAEVNVVVPDGVTEIGEGAFRDKADLQSVTLPASVKKIGYEAFKGCAGLTGMVIPDSVLQVDADAFKECTGLKTATIGKGLVALSQGMFFHCTSLAAVNIPNSVTKIGEGAFEGCSALTNIAIPGSVTEICSKAFMETGLTSLTIPGTVKTVGSRAFRGCSKLADLTICDGVEEIGEVVYGETFQGCTSLTHVELPDSMTWLGKGTFADCTSLTSLTLSKGMTSAKAEIVGNCKALETLVIPTNITDISFYICGIGSYEIKEAFPRLTIYGEANSAADLYAYERGIPFVVMEPQSVEPAPIPASGTAYASTQSVNVDGKAVEFQMYALKDAGGNATNYIKLRDLANILNGTAAQFNVGWDGAVTITAKTTYTPNGTEGSTPFSGDRAYQEATAPTKVNGQTAQLAAFTLSDDNGGGYTYYQLRDLGNALGFNVGWSADKGVFVETGRPYDPAN